MVVAVLAVAGCGSSAKSSSTTAAPPVTAAPATTVAPTPTPATQPRPTTPAAPTTAAIDWDKSYGHGITLATTCREYFDRDQAQRYDAVNRMTLDFAVDSPGNPMWGLNMDSVCGSSPNMRLGDFFARAGARG
jgi:hypothetical protein